MHSEGNATGNGFFECVGSDLNVIQLDTAFYGVNVAVKKGGQAETCIKKLGGLSIAQLRWMYSNFNEDELRNHGWTSDSVPNSDGNPNTKYWSELLDDAACPEVQIHIAGPDPLSL
jgi:hypothetical protein